MKNVWILGGGGDTGRRLCARLQDTCILTVTSRSPSDIDFFGERVEVVKWVPGEDPFEEVISGDPPDVVINLIGAWLVGARAALVDATQEVLTALSPATRYVHCSAVSVWGSRPGETVDENSPVFADQRVALLHLEAETLVDEHRERGIEGVVLRLPHIYGPRRERTINLMRAGRFVILGNGQNRMHHLHVDDFVEVLARTVELEDIPSPMYAVVDDDDTTYGAYCDFVTAITGTTPLPFMSLSDALQGELESILGPHFARHEVVAEFWRFMTSDLRVSNRKMKDELGVELQYPTFRQGLPGVLDAEIETTIGGEMVEHIFEAWTQMLRGAERVQPATLADEHASRAGEGATMDVFAFETPSVRWGRVAHLDSARMKNLNAVVFPTVKTDAPILGIEIALDADGAISFAAFDLWGAVSDEFSETLTPARERFGDACMPIEGRLAAVLTNQAVAVRGVEPEAVFAAGAELLHSYLESVEDASERTDSVGRAEQAAVCQRMLDRPGAVDILASMFTREWAEEFLENVYYPPPE